MNKKAIAAFAAGATLLAGFAMATPAFAEAPKTVVPHNVSTEPANGDSDELKLFKGNLATAYTDADNAASAMDTAAKDVDASVATINADHTITLANTYVYKFDEKGKVAKTGQGAADDDKMGKVNTYLDKLADYNTKLAAVKAAEALVTKNTPVVKASANVAVAKLKDTEKPLKEAQTKLDEAFGKYDAAYVAYKSAQQDKADAEKALKDYTRNHENEALPTYHSEVARLTKAFNVADEAAKKAKKACGDAETDFNKAKSAFNDAFAKYAAAYEAALAAKADVSAFATPASLGHDFNSEYQPGEGFVPGAGASHAGKPGAAQPGKPGQAAGQAGANGAAGAKTEVENKNGKDKRGNTHTGTGVGVTLTALAATMLAGMGAAVRKARH